MRPKAILIIAILCVLLTGCATSTKPVESLVTNKPELEQNALPSIAVASLDAELAEVSPSPSTGNAAKIAYSYSGLDDCLFQAVYSALTQSTWHDIEEAFMHIEEYLPKGTKGSISTDTFPKLDLLGEEDANSEALTITRETLEELRLAYICIWGNGNYDLILAFDIQNNGAYVPVSAQWVDSFDSHWYFARHGNERWFIAQYLLDHGTGIRIEKTDWYNLERNSLDISYLSSASEINQPWCPLGYWTFNGELSDARVTEDISGFTIEMDASSILLRTNSDDLWSGEEYRWEHMAPVIIRYDKSNGNASAETGYDHWYYGIANQGNAVDGYCSPFIDELTQASAGEGADAWWARWMLKGGKNWEAFFETNGLVYEAAE